MNLPIILFLVIFEETLLLHEVHISFTIRVSYSICTPLRPDLPLHFSHDTLGNRASRAYLGTNPAKGNNNTISIEEKNENADTLSFFSYIDTLASLSYDRQDTIIYGPLVKSPAEKEAYLDSLMKAVLIRQTGIFSSPFLYQMHTYTSF